MKNIRVFLSKNFQFLEVKFSIYLNRRVFVMKTYHKTIQPLLSLRMIRRRLHIVTFHKNEVILLANNECAVGQVDLDILCLYMLGRHIFI